MKRIKFVFLFLFLSGLLIFSQGCHLMSFQDETEESPVKSKIYSVNFSSFEIHLLKTIEISGIEVQEASASLSTTDQLQLSVKILSSDEEKLEKFLEYVQVKNQGDTLNISLFNTEKDLSAKDLKIELPSSSSVKIILKDSNSYVFKVHQGKILKERYSGESPQELISLLSSAKLPKDQLAILAMYLRHHPIGRLFQTDEVRQILEAIPTERLIVAQMLSARVIDRENLGLLESSFIPEEWQMIVKYLSQ